MAAASRPSILPRRRIVASALLFVAVIAGCTSDEPGTQPTPPVSTFEAGQFDDLPLPPKSDPLGPRAEAQKTVTRSYRVPGMSPAGVLDFYTEELGKRGWTAAEPVEQPGSVTYRRTWTSAAFRLIVSSSPAPTLGTDDAAAQVETQFSLSLERP